MPKFLEKIRSFNNHIFSATLWTNGEYYFAVCCWQSGDDEVGESKDGEVVKVYELEVSEKDEVIPAFVEVVQTLRKCSRYETY